jgi:SPX domain
LQKLIKELPTVVPSEDEKNETGQIGSPDSSTSPTISLAQDHGDKTGEIASEDDIHEIAETVISQQNNRKDELGKNPGEIAFFKLLHAEFKKASFFFDKAQQEFGIREERVREGIEIMKRSVSIMANDRWPLLAKSIYRLYKDLLLLETFAIMTYCSFSKILKKHDKVTGHDTRNAFMTNVVSQANFTTYPKLLEMISRCESLYADVSERLLQEGKQGLYEDERLFINMISRLNEQTLETADAPERSDDNNRRFSHVAMVNATSQSRYESTALSQIRSMVEENDARNAAMEVSEGQTEEDSLRDTKRPRLG